MPGFTFDWDLSQIITSAISIVAILAGTFITLAIVNRVVPRIISARIPMIREESTDELASRSQTLSEAVTRTLSFCGWVLAVLMIISELGVSIAPILASVGVASLAVGFAAQSLIRDYINGFFIIMEDWYRVGEVAVVAGIGGLVVAVSLRRTVLRDLDGRLHNIPNSKIELASNLTRDWARINMNVPVAYGEDLDHVIRVINEVGQQLKDDPVFGPDLLTTPHSERVDNFGDSGIEIKILGDTKPIRQWALAGELRRRLKARFDSEGIEIPWPHTKVFFGNAPPREEAPSG